MSTIKILPSKMICMCIVCSVLAKDWTTHWVNLHSTIHAWLSIETQWRTHCACIVKRKVCPLCSYIVPERKLCCSSSPKEMFQEFLSIAQNILMCNMTSLCKYPSYIVYLFFSKLVLMSDIYFRIRENFPCPKKRAGEIKDSAWECVAASFFHSVTRFDISHESSVESAIGIPNIINFLWALEWHERVASPVYNPSWESAPLSVSLQPKLPWFWINWNCCGFCLAQIKLRTS